MGDLPDKVKALERKFHDLRQKIENSPWTAFQRLMMEHARGGLSERDFDKLKQMHKMTPAERKV